LTVSLIVHLHSSCVISLIRCEMAPLTVSLIVHLHSEYVISLICCVIPLT
jgi:hypothetical protein